VRLGSGSSHPEQSEGSLGLRVEILRSLRSLRMTPLGLLALLLACQATTTRPTYGPVSGAETVVLELEVPGATRLLADRLKADSLPVTVIEQRDGFVETPWFDTTTSKPTGRRPLGAGVVRVRGWVDPEKPGFSRLTVETLFRDIADPSLPERELDREVPPDHPTAVRVRAVLDSLRKRYGEPDRAG